MTHSLTDAFRSYATESEEVDLTVHDQQNANPEPFVAVTDETTTVLEDAVADIAEDADKLTENGDLAEKLIDTVESMEGMILAVKSMKAAGENLTGSHTRLLMLGAVQSFEGRGLPLEWYQKEVLEVTASLESEAYDYSEEAEGKLAAVKDRVLTVLKNAYNSFVELLKRVIDNFRGKATAFDAAGVRLQKVAADLDGKSAGDAKLSQDGYSSLLTRSGSFNPDGAIADANDAVDKAYTLAAEQIKKLEAKAATGSAADALSGEVILTGGKAIKLEDGKAKLVTVKAADKSGKEVAVATPAQIRAIGKTLVDTANTLNGLESDNRKILSALDALVKKFSAALGKSDDKEQKAGGGARLKEVVAGINGVRDIVPLAIKHATAVGKEANRFALASAARYKAA